MNDVGLLERVHPDPEAQATFDSLVGIDHHKEDLLDELATLLGGRDLAAWLARHHPGGLALAGRLRKSARLVLLEGEVGTGKSALAGAIGTPLAHALDRRVATLETPSDLRGWGHVGEMSARITAAFGQARRRARDVGAGLLVIDEADDVATSRAQMQAHHEDRAGLNVLIKQVDELSRTSDPLVVLLITNRALALDPAVVRRTALRLTFVRPDGLAREAVFRQILAGIDVTADDVDRLVQASEHETPYTYSDLVDRLARVVLRTARRSDRAVTVDLVADCLVDVQPTPLMGGES